MSHFTDTDPCPCGSGDTFAQCCQPYLSGAQPAPVAERIDHFVQQDAADGFILVPHLTPGGLDEFVDRVVPLLQERGVFRADYTGPTLRDHLGLPLPERR